MTSAPAGDAAASAARDPVAPFGLYVHFPFCAQRCHYCAFYFVVGRAEVRSAYVDAVVAEIGRAAHDPRFAGRAVDSVFFGGGTPSLLPPAEVARILTAVRDAFPTVADAEISLESNPDGLEAGDLEALRAAGVNRLTLGWQSLRDAHLRLLTRTHSAAESRQALQRARLAGFENVAVDLIFGVPGQTAQGWVEELDEVGALGPDHVSAYELTVEEGTRLAARVAAGRFALADEEERARMFESTDSALERHGIRRYEISNFARPGRECRHNLSGWRSGDLLGVGASAASHVANARWTNVADLDQYVARTMAGEPVAGEAEVLDERTWAAEDLYLGLRTVEGVGATDRLERVPPGDRAPLLAVLDRAEADGLLERGPERSRVRLTPRGRLLADTVFDALLSASR